MIVYDDVIMPDCVISAGLEGKNLRMNDRTQNQGGFDSVNVIWSNTLRQFDVGFKPMPPIAWAEMEGLFEITDAGAFGFLMEDPKDYRIAVGDGFMQPVLSGTNVGTMGSGFGVPVYQLYKRYRVKGSTRVKNRKITRPKAGTVFNRNGTPLVVGVAPGNVSISSTTGQITFVPDANQAIQSITVGASTILNFANGTGMVAAMAVGQRVFVNGVTGTAGAALNARSHVVSAKGATSLTLSVATTGLAVTLPGTAYKYPQATDTLTASGEFYVPVHFANDSQDWDMVRPGIDLNERLVAGVGVTLIEIKE